MAKNLIGGIGMTKIYGTGNASFEAAYMDCKAVADGIVDAKSFQKADKGVVLYHMDRILEALEKQIPKKPNKMTYKLLVDDGWEYACPTCGRAVGINRNNTDYTQESDYCSECGQKLNWD